MFKFEKTDGGYMAEIVEKTIIERSKKVDSAILGEIRKIAVDNVIEEKIILNEKNVADALRNYQDGYKTIKSEVAREIFEKIETLLSLNSLQGDVFIGKYFDADLENDISELKKKYTEQK